ncbi:MAG TPA: hypothetical protein VHK24_09915 [Steroidobacter sp.]|nr:hypothetical protein [Steroidobacter sp.]
MSLAAITVRTAISTPTWAAAIFAYSTGGCSKRGACRSARTLITGQLRLEYELVPAWGVFAEYLYATYYCNFERYGYDR